MQLQEGDRDVSQDRISRTAWLFHVKTSTNLAKRVRGDDNCDLKHQRVI